MIRETVLGDFVTQVPKQRLTGVQTAQSSQTQSSRPLSKFVTSVLAVRTHVRFGLQTMCEGGGQANLTILELCD